MPVKRITINLELNNNKLIAVDDFGSQVTIAGISGENEATWLHFHIPLEWQGLNVKLQVIAENGNFDESEYATSGNINMPLRVNILQSGIIKIVLAGSDITGLRKTDACVLTVLNSPTYANIISRIFPQDFEQLQNSVSDFLTRHMDGGVINA